MTNTVLLAAEVSKTSTGEAVQFWILGIVAVLGALGTILMKKAVHSALALAATMLCLAVFYLAQGAVFLGIVQIVVYTGAIMMLFLFVLMLVGVQSADSLKETIKGQRWAAALAGIGFGVLLIAGIANAGITRFAAIDPTPASVAARQADPELANATAQGNVQGIAHLLFTKYVWAFEVTSALLITAALGAMVLAHRERLKPRRTQAELAAERVRANINVAPMPAPGVYARHNAVDIPAILPDGSIAERSVNATLRARGQIRDVSREGVHRVAEIEENVEAWDEEPGRAELPTARQQAGAATESGTSGASGSSDGTGSTGDTGDGEPDANGEPGANGGPGGSGGSGGPGSGGPGGPGDPGDSGPGSGGGTGDGPGDDLPGPETSVIAGAGSGGKEGRA